MDDKQIIQERKEKVFDYLKRNYNLISYAILAFIVYLSIKIRTRNLPLLRDVTTGSWTLGPDLDPFLFLRWAKSIVENGTLQTIDTMRYVPLGYKTTNELLLHPYMMAWFHNLASFFGSQSVTQSSVLYPVFMFALTVIAFFLFTRQIFFKSLGSKKSNIIALISSFFLTTVPVLLPRTIAGIPEKESAAFLFLFLAFYFFLSSWNSNKMKSIMSFGILAGISTAAMALIWGGYAFIFLTIAPTVFVAFLLGKVDKNKLYSYSTWIISSFLLMYPFSSRYTIKGFLVSINVGPSVAVLVIILIHIFISRNEKIKNKINSTKLKIIPLPIISSAITFIIFIILATILFGFSYVPQQLTSIFNNLIKPATSRLIQTVAENRQPFFTEWSNSFGPALRGIPVFFWLFFIGSIHLFYSMIKKTFKKSEKEILTASYVFFLFALIFSRYDRVSILNGTNLLSNTLYLLGFLVLIVTVGFYHFKYHKDKNQHQLREIDFSYILLFMLFLLSIISARAAVRLIMVLAIPSSIIVSYFTVELFSGSKKIKSKNKRNIFLIISIIIILLTLFSANTYYNTINQQAAIYAPSQYTQQWQKAMSWVRVNTSSSAVFAHWWDYGYWIQSIGERATVLDGGNSISYWNHLMGRYALTGTDNKKALEFLYSHNVTHFLIDSTDIGKYSAFSTIGSNEKYDRASFIQPIVKDSKQTLEKKNSTISIYPTGISTDEDILYDLNGTRIFLPGGKSALGAILIERDNSSEIISNPIGIFVYKGKQFRLPLRYAYDGSFKDFKSGIESGVFIFPRASQSNNGVNIDKSGALLYLSSRTVKSQLARLYLYGEENNFKMVHKEENGLVSQIKSFNKDYKSDFVYFNGFRGPIKIWEINYPSDIKINSEFLKRDYPKSLSIGR